MLSALKKFLNVDADPELKEEHPRAHVALAALLVEMSKADFDDTDVEDTAITDLLRAHFSLQAGEVEALLTHAKERVTESVSMHDFTRALCQELGADERTEVIGMLWQVALADNKLDRYEEYLVRKVADLLYVSHSDVIRMKHAAEQG